jgi:hypothetical protein
MGGIQYQQVSQSQSRCGCESFAALVFLDDKPTGSIVVLKARQSQPVCSRFRPYAILGRNLATGSLTIEWKPSRGSALCGTCISRTTPIQWLG